LNPQRIQPALLIPDRPLPGTYRSTPHQLLDGGHGFSRSIQAHCLKALEFTRVTGLLLGLPKGRHIVGCEFKLSFCHVAILHQ
jgi:hypothetical protein